ncbi:VOC family protein [Pseudotabrizicola sediminis]|uniref:VOC family protein n=1 Tax=Pseudotabrizicola sediminis TaxID=2486418 RepID=A0ABY2KJX3_9RHOB|nr:VOC family protein [Pseudotabrizicola sediminis]TGD42720.1 VOC family protein [Pseudotabrizicola sediminis]
MTVQGLPFWYELTASEIPASTAFYGPVMDWQFKDSGVPGFAYTVATKGDAMTAGLMGPDTPMPEFWMVYFAVDDCDATAARVTALGGAIHRAPEDVPGTGRFAIVTDPQGAVFGLMQPEDGQPGTAYSLSMQVGHANWHELQTSDPAAALTFYTTLLGWTAGQAMDMGAEGIYQMVCLPHGDIGGLMPLSQPGIPPHWLPIFGTDSIAAAMARIASGGGTTLHGPMEVPGGAFVCYAADPHGATFGLVGPP